MAAAFLLGCVWVYVNLGASNATGSSAREVSVSEARTLMDVYRAVVLDTRTREAFDKGHIPGAVAFPAAEFAKRLNALALDRSRPVVVYCGDGAIRGPDIARELQARGYDGAVNLAGGFAAWQAAGQPVTR